MTRDEYAMTELAYIVQLDLPRSPIKIGHTGSPRRRFHHFSAGTPVDCRIVGVTGNGIEREAEMLAATKDAKIKGEWRYATPALRALVGKYHAQGSWYHKAENHREHFEDAKVARRIEPFYNGRVFNLGPSNYVYPSVREVIAAAAIEDPSVLFDYHGFVPAKHSGLEWPPESAAA